MLIKNRSFSSVFNLLLKYLCFWFAFVLIFVGIEVFRKFGDVTFEQVIFHIRFGATGLLKSDKSFIYGFLRNIVVYPLLCTGLSLFLLHIIKEKVKKSDKAHYVEQFFGNKKLSNFLLLGFFFGKLELYIVESFLF